MWFASNKAKHTLNQYFHLPASGKEQDWEIELSDVDRIEEFMIALKHEKFSLDVKQALVALILASFNDAISDNKFELKQWHKFRSLVIDQKPDFIEIYRIWYEDVETDDSFFLAPYIKDLLETGAPII